MNLKEINVAVNIRDNNIHVVRGIIKNDTGHILNLKLIDGTDAFDFTGYDSLTMNLLKPDGTFIVDGTGPRLTAEDLETLEDTINEQADSEDEEVDTSTIELVNDIEHIQAVDPEHGMLSIKLSYEQATILTGMHFITISFYSKTESDAVTGEGEVVKVTTARVNYYVEDNIDDTSDEEVESVSEFPILQQALAIVTDVFTSEAVRVANETTRQAAEAVRIANEDARIQAEAARVSTDTGIVAVATAAKEAAEDILEVMERIIHGEITDYDDLAPVVVQSQMTSAIADALATLATIDGSVSGRTLKINRGLASALDAAAGELYYATDEGKLYIGIGNSEYVCLNEPEHHIGPLPPSDTSKIWIDTSEANAIKVYQWDTSGDDMPDEGEWVGTATATFG